MPNGVFRIQPMDATDGDIVRQGVSFKRRGEFNSRMAQIILKYLKKQGVRRWQT